MTFPSQVLVADTKTQTCYVTVYSSGTPVTGLTADDVRIGLASENRVQARTVKMASGSWTELGGGEYRFDIVLTDDDICDPFMILILRKSPTYVGTLDLLVQLLWWPRYNATKGTGTSGLALDRTVWLPFKLVDGGTYQTGRVAADIDFEVEYRTASGAWDTLTIVASEMVELEWSVGGDLGVYLIRFDGDLIDEKGVFYTRLAHPDFDVDISRYDVVQPEKETVRFTVKTASLPATPVQDVRVYITPVGGSSVVASGVSDALGRFEVYLSPGSYRATLVKTPSVFSVNNQLFSVVARDAEGYEKELSATPARMVSDKGPFVLANGDDLKVRVNSNATQTVTFLNDDLPTGVALSSIDAPTLASMLRQALYGVDVYHSVIAEELGSIVMETLGTGSTQTLEVVGGTAAVKIGFPDIVEGEDDDYEKNYFVLTGDSFTPTLEPLASNQVEMTARVLDMELRPVANAEIIALPTEGAGLGFPTANVDGEDVLITRKERRFYSDAEGNVLNRETGLKPRFLKGQRVDFLLGGRVVRKAFTIPNTPFNLAITAASAEDAYSILTPNYPTLPRS